MSRRHGACPCAWRRKPLWARGRDRARAQLTRECDTATMGAPRQGVNSATRVRGPSTGARTQSLPRPRSARPRHGAGACPARLSRAGPSIAGAQLIAPRCCGRARVRARSRGVPMVGGQDTPPKVSGRPHWVRRPSHHHPPKQASGCPQPTAAPSGRCGQPEANPPPPVIVVSGCACGLQVPCRVPASHLLMHAHAQSGASGHASGPSVAGVVVGCCSGAGIVRTGWGARFAVFACFAGIAVFAVHSSSVRALM